MKLLIQAVVCFAFFNVAFAGNGQGPLVGPAATKHTFDLSFDKETKKPALIDYTLDIKPFTHPELSLASLEKKPAVLFYFSALCPHCQKSIPFIDKMAKELEKDSIQVFAIASSRNRENQIADFITKYKVSIPLFHDHKSAFGKKYGNGRVPMVVMVGKNGTFVIVKNFKHETSPAQMIAAFKDKKKF